jgi:site-specific DNA-methyltransferase (adenine-specific)
MDIKIYNLDVFDFLNTVVPDNSIDLIVTDPPYNLKKADWDTFKSEKDFLDWTFAWIDESIKKLKKNGSLYIFNTPYNSAFILQHLVSQGMIFQNWITWDKRDGLGSAKRKYSNGQETILFFTKGKNHTFNYDDIRVPYESSSRIAHAAKKGILKNGKRWFPNPNGRLCGEVWHFSSQRHKEKINGKTQKLPHLTPKPLDMIERIIKASSNEGNLVMDMFLGSGTTALACKKLNRNFIGNELNKDFFQLSLNKINYEPNPKINIKY